MTRHRRSAWHPEELALGQHEVQEDDRAHDEQNESVRERPWRNGWGAGEVISLKVVHTSIARAGPALQLVDKLLLLPRHTALCAKGDGGANPTSEGAAWIRLHTGNGCTRRSHLMK